MAEHSFCLHEASLAGMAKDIEYIRASLDKINSLPTKVALHGQSISRLWWMVGGVAVVAIGVAGKAIINFFTG